MANNRFDSPSKIDYDLQYNVPKIFMPNYEALGAIIENEDQKKQIIDALLEKMPNAITQDKPAQDAMAKQLEGMTQELTDAFSSGDMNTYRSKRRDIEKRIKSNWQPSGSFSIMQSRYDQFLKEKEYADKLKEKDASYATVNSDVDDMNWMKNIKGMSLDDKNTWTSLPSRDYTAYQDYQKALSDILKDMRPDKEEVVKVGNRWITKTSREEVNPNDIIAAESKLRQNPKFSKQLQLEASTKGYFTPEGREAVKATYLDGSAKSYDENITKLKDLSKLSEQEVAGIQRDLNELLGLKLAVDGKAGDQTKAAAKQAIEKLNKDKEEEKTKLTNLTPEEIDNMSLNDYVSNTYALPNANVYGYKKLGMDLSNNQEYLVNLKAQKDLDNMKTMEQYRTKQAPLLGPGGVWRVPLESVKTQVETLSKSIGATANALRTNYKIPEGVKLESLLDPAKFKEVTGASDADYKVYKDQFNTLQQDTDNYEQLRESLYGKPDDKFKWKAGKQGGAFQQEVERISQDSGLSTWEVLDKISKGDIGAYIDPKRFKAGNFRELAQKALKISDVEYTDYREGLYKENSLAQSQNILPIANSDYDKAMTALTNGFSESTTKSMLAQAADQKLYKRNGLPSTSVPDSPIKSKQIGITTLNGATYLSITAKHENGVESTALQPMSTVQDLNNIDQKTQAIILQAISDDEGQIMNDNNSRAIYQTMGKSKLLQMASGQVPLKRNLQNELQKSKDKGVIDKWIFMSNARIEGVGNMSVELFNEHNTAVDDKVRVKLLDDNGQPLNFFEDGKTNQATMGLSDWDRFLGNFGGEFLPRNILNKGSSNATIRNNNE